MHKIPTDAFDMLVTLEKRPFERAGREVVVRLLDETLPDGTKLVAASDPSYPPELAALEEHPAVLVHEGDLSLTERQLRVSIVGSRDASDSARADARRVAREDVYKRQGKEEDLHLRVRDVHDEAAAPELHGRELDGALRADGIGRVGPCTPGKIKTVSYTHLDVYKRQGFLSKGISEFRGILADVCGRGA